MNRRFTFLSLFALFTIVLGCEVSFSQKLYKLTVSPSVKGGTIVIPKTVALGGEYLQIQVIPDENYKIAEASLQYTTGGKSVLIAEENNMGAFYMPAGDTELYVEFVNDREVSLEFPTDFYSFTGSIALDPTVMFDGIEQERPRLSEFIWEVDNTSQFSISDGVVTCSTPGATAKVTISTIDHYVSASCTVACLPYQFTTIATESGGCEITGIVQGSALPDTAEKTQLYTPSEDILANYAPPDEEGNPTVVEKFYFFIPDAINGRAVTGIQNSDWADNLQGIEKVTVLRMPYKIELLPQKAFTSFSSLKVLYAEPETPPVISNDYSSSQDEDMSFFNSAIDLIYVNSGMVSAYANSNESLEWGEYYKPYIIEKGQYRIRIKDTINGTIQIMNNHSATFGATVSSSLTVTAAADTNFELVNDGMKATTDAGAPIQLTQNSPTDPHTFIMPDNHVTFSATFKLGGGVNVDAGENFSYTFKQDDDTDYVDLYVYPYTGYSISSVTFAKTASGAAKPDSGYTDQPPETVQDKANCTKYRFSNIIKGEDVLYVKVSVLAKTFAMELVLNHEPWKENKTVPITGKDGANVLIYDSAPAPIVFDGTTIQKRQNSILDGIYYTDATGNKINYYSMDSENIATSLRRWDQDAEQDTVFTLTAEWRGEVSNISFDAGYFSNPDLGYVGSIQNTPNNMTERYGELMTNVSLPMMDCPGFKLLYYADKPQTTAEQVTNGTLPEGATAYYERKSARGTQMVPAEKAQKDGETAPRGTYWDLIGKDDGSGSVVLYAIWGKAFWDGQTVSPPRGVSQNMIYTPDELAYLCSVEAPMDKTYYIMTDIDIGSYITSFYPIGANFRTEIDDMGLTSLYVPSEIGTWNPISFTGKIVPGKLSASGTPVEDTTGYRKISNLKINVGSQSSTTTKPVGFIGRLGTNGSISRIIFDESCKFSAYGNNCAGIGSFAGVVDGGLISDCKNYGTVSQNIDTSATTVTSQTPVGGIVGKIIRWQPDKSMNKLENYGPVTGLGDTGGIVGNAVFETQLRMEACFNEGAVNGNNYNTIVSLGPTATGGLFGNVLAKSAIIVSSCYNTGLVTTLNMVGGTGGLIGQITRYTTMATLDMENCYNAAQIKGSSYCAGFIGLARLTARINNCYSFGHVFASTLPRAMLLYAQHEPILSNCVVAKSNTTEFSGLNLDMLQGMTVYKDLPVYQTQSVGYYSPIRTEILVYTKGSGIRSTETISFKPLGNGLDGEILDILNGGYNSGSDAIWKWGGGKNDDDVYTLNEITYFDNQTVFKNRSRPVLIEVGEGIDALPDEEVYVPRVERIKSDGSPEEITAEILLDPTRLTSGSYKLIENLNLASLISKDGSTSNGSIILENTHTVTLDLNGFVISGAQQGPVIINRGTLTIIDSQSSKAHKYDMGTNKHYIWDGDANTGTYVHNGGAITGGRENSDGYGGAIHNTGTLSITGSNIIGNYSPSYAGAITSTGTLTLNGTKIIGNASNNGAAAIHINNSTTNALSMDAVTISNNYSVKSGVVTVEAGTATIQTSTISDNYTAGIRVMKGGTASILTSRILRNNAMDGAAGLVQDTGGGIWTSGTTTISDTEIVENKGLTGNNGAGVYVDSGSCTIKGNTIISRNTAKITGNATGVGVNGTGSSLTIESGGVNGTMYVGGSGTLSITGGYFSTDPQSYTTKTVISNTGSNATYPSDVYLYKVE